MKLNKIILICAIALGSIVESKATSTTVVIAAGGVTNVAAMSNSVCIVSQLIVAPNATNTNTGTLALYDSPTTNTSYVTASYSSIVWTNGTFTETYTNFVGIKYTNTFLASVAQTNTIAANTNAYNIPFAVNYPPTNILTFPSVGIRFNHGLLISNTQPVTITVTYQQFNY